MTQRRSAATLLSRFAWLLLVVGVLTARGLTPEGWMPVVNAAGGIDFALCDGMGPIEPAAASMDPSMSMGSSMTMTHGKMDHQAPAKGQSENHPCTGAGVNLADLTPPMPAVVAPARPMLAAPTINRVATVPGRGLAAPPPPATGPPTRA